MKLSSFLQESARFQTKGRWYNSDQVDDFIDKMVEGIDKLELENENLKREVSERRAPVKEIKELRDENNRLKEMLRARREEAPRQPMQQMAMPVPVPQTGGGSGIQHMRKINEELEKERDDLIESIKLLRRFREEFRSAVKNDADVMIKRMDQLDSDELL